MCSLTVRYPFFTYMLAELKAWYDKYGEYGLKEGIPNEKGCK